MELAYKKLSFMCQLHLTSTDDLKQLLLERVLFYRYATFRIRPKFQTAGA